MRVTFKDVGQGDSIILEWNDGEESKIGLIDCSKKQKKNPVLEHLKLAQYREIEFIVLSHPHSDHYSGFQELFSYLKTKRIRVRSFVHTLSYIGSDYFKWCEIGTEESTQLAKLIEEMGSLLEEGLIEKVEHASERWRLDLAEGIYLKCLSPSNEEAAEYQRIVSYKPEENPKEASRASNFLATVFKLTVHDSYYLLTSDSEKFTFERLLRQNRHRNLTALTLCLCQLPHHGSIKNHYPPFWEALNRSGTHLHAVASAGLNLKYKHPTFEVLENFHGAGFRIHCTNIVNGMVEYVEYLKGLAVKSSVLDTGSTLAEDYMDSNDRVFLFKEGEFLLIED